MATSTSSIANLAQLIQPMFLGSKTTKKTDSNVTNQFNSVLQTLLPQMQGSVVSQQELDALVQGILGKASQSFAPSRATQTQAGAYNSTAMQSMQNDAMAKATNESIQALLNAKFTNAQSQQNAAGIASQLVGNMANSSTTTETPAALGDMAGPLGAYALYKLFTNSEGGAAGAGTGGAQLGKFDLGSATNAAAGAGSFAGGAPSLSTFDPSMSLAPASTFSKLGGAGSDFAATSFDIGDSLGNLSTSFDELASTGTLANSGGAASGGAPGGIDVFGAISDTVGGIPVIGESLASGATAAGEAFSSLNNAFTVGGIPLLPGLPALLQGDIKGAAGNVGGAYLGNMAGSALASSGFGASLGNLGWALGPVGGILGTLLGGKLASKCYITTATMAGTGNTDDNSYELTTMRKFRDEFMAATPVGQELIQDYYDKAPAIVEIINKRPNAQMLYATIYKEYLAPAIAAIEAGDNYRALTIYREMAQATEELAYGITGA